MVNIGRTVFVLWLMGALALGCKSGGDEGRAGAGGASGFSGAGVAGSVVPVAGTGVAGSAGGAAAGSSAAGSSAAGSSEGAFLVPGCEAASSALPGPMLHAEAATVLAVATTCGFMSCHSDRAQAGLYLLDKVDLRTLLVGVPSCEAPMMPLVDGAGADAGLEHSYLWVKLVGAANADGTIIGDAASWGMPGAKCQGTASAPYGVRMPQSASPMPTSDARLAKIRDWICAGAPGPM